MRNLGFKPEGERMAVYQSHGESQNTRTWKKREYV